jgi:hypothetical protein
LQKFHCLSAHPFSRTGAIQGAEDGSGGRLIQANHQSAAGFLGIGQFDHGFLKSTEESYGVNRTVGNKVKSMIGKLFEVYDEAIGLGEHDLACVLQWVITAYAKRHDIPIDVDAFERHVVESAANHRRASIDSVAREQVGH